MKKIKKISQNRKHPDLYLIHLDDESTFYVELDTLLKNNLKKGIQLEDSKIEDFIETSQIAKTKSDVIRKLAYKNYTEGEIRNFIERKDKIHSYEKFIAGLKERNIINDEEYTRRYIKKSLNLSKPKGKNLLSSELYKRGIPKEIIDKELLELDENIDELQIYIQKYLSKQRITDQRKLKEKLMRHLLSRGYSYSTIISNIDSLFT